MSNPANNKKPIDLEELLKREKNSMDDLDDFEREALEGFSTLESTEEALNLKEKLDVRMEKEVFSVKKRTLTIYWAAAAGLVLLFMIVGLFKFSPIFEQKEMAQQITPTHEELLKDELNKTQPDQNAEIKSEFKSEENRQDIIPQDKTTVSEQKNTKLDDIRNEGPLLEEKSKSNNGGGEAQGDFFARKTADSEDDAKKSEGEKSVAYPNAPSKSDEALAEDIAQDNNQEKEAKPVANTREANNKDMNNLANGMTPRMVPGSDKKTKSKSSGKAAPAEEPSRAKQEAAPASEASGMTQFIPPVILTITKETLDADISKFMKNENMDFSFTCNLSISRKNHVTKVEFKDKSNASEAELKSLEKYLLKLKCFHNNIPETVNYYLEFKKN